MKDYIIKLIKNDIGQAADNRYRAELAFKNVSPELMDEKYGRSDNTRREILDGYIEWENKAKKALAWIEKINI
jgi:hypothetical protein